MLHLAKNVQDKHPYYQLILLLLCLCVYNTTQAAEADREQPMNIESDTLQVDEAKQISIFTGKVHLTQGSLEIFADQLEIHQDKEGVKLGIAIGKPAHLRQKQNSSNEYMEGYGGRIEYDTRAETVDFFIQAHVKRAKDDVRGDHITYNTQTETYKVVGKPDLGEQSPTGGRVQVIIQPKEKKNGNTPAESDEKQYE